MGKGRGQKVNRGELAAVFGISLPTVDTWVRAGCPYDEKGQGKGRPWVFDTADVAAWREERARAEGGGEDVADLAAYKLRRERASTLRARAGLGAPEAPGSFCGFQAPQVVSLEMPEEEREDAREDHREI